jgi:hypothetical protein
MDKTTLDQVVTEVKEVAARIAEREYHCEGYWVDTIHTAEDLLVHITAASGVEKLGHQVNFSIPLMGKKWIASVCFSFHDDETEVPPNTETNYGMDAVITPEGEVFWDYKVDVARSCAMEKSMWEYSHINSIRAQWAEKKPNPPYEFGEVIDIAL